MPLTAPPFKTQACVPCWLNATEMGNSPSLDTGWPICTISTGFLGSMMNSETVFEPAYKDRN